MTTFPCVLHCFGVFWTVSDVVFRRGFKADILATCDFLDVSERQVSLTSLTLSVSVAVPITYWIRVLEAIGATEGKGSGL